MDGSAASQLSNWTFLSPIRSSSRALQMMPRHPRVNLLNIPLALGVQERGARDGDSARLAAILDLGRLQHMLTMAGFSLGVGIRVAQPLDPQLESSLSSNISEFSVSPLVWSRVSGIQ